MEVGMLWRLGRRWATKQGDLVGFGYQQKKTMSQAKCCNRQESEAKMNRFLLWLVMDSKVRLGRLAPWVFSLAIWRWPYKVRSDKRNDA